MAVKKKFAWSWSALTGFENCAWQHYRLRVAKDIFEQPSPQMQDGNRQHKALEDRIKMKKPLPADMRRLEPLMKKVEAMPGKVMPEFKVALTADLKPTTYFAKDVWLRGVFDLTVIKGAAARIIDYKTGKRKPESAQLMLFAGMAFAQFPKLEKVGTSFWWLKTKETDRAEFHREEAVPLIWQEFIPRVERMEEAYESGYFPEKPSGLCRGWCPVKDCQHWEPKEH